MVKGYRRYLRNKLRSLLVVFYYKIRLLSYKKQLSLAACAALLLSAGFLAAAPWRQQSLTSVSSETDSQSEPSSTVLPETTVKVNEESVIESDAAANNSATNTDVQVRIKSSVTTRSNGEQSTKTYSSQSNGVKKEIIKESSDGNSSVRFKIDAGQDAEVKVKERNGSIRIDIEEEKEL